MKIPNLTYLRPAVLALFAAAVFIVLYGFHPEVLNYHEQNQLFLWTTSYFFERLSQPGGLADWLSECLVQFFYVPWLGALLVALLFTAIAALSNLWVGLLFFVPLLKIDCLMSYPVAFLLALVAARSVPHLPRLQGSTFWYEFLLLPGLYWLLGPLVFLYGALRMLDEAHAAHPSRGVIYVGYLVVMLTTATGFHRLFFAQWPLQAAFCGLNYYRIVSIHPPVFLLIPVTAFLYALRKVLPRIPAKVCGWMAVLGFGLTWAELKDYDGDQFEVLRQDMLARQERWDEIIARARKYQVRMDMSSEYVNLALAQKRQLAEQMFRFYQSGPDALLNASARNNMSNYASAEAFYHLGMINSCLRYCSDLQESIGNNRKSGRLERYIALCQLANGRTAVARKHLDLLRRSLYYRTEAESLLRQGTNAEVTRLQRLRYKDDMLYSYPEKAKLFGLLFVNNPDNRMALDYFLAQMLLEGNLQGFMQHLSWAQQYGGYVRMPAGYQDAVQCIQAQGNVPGSPYAAYVKNMLNKQP